MLPFTIKYQPKIISDMIGQDSAIASLKRFVLNYKSQKKKAMLLYGPTGTGKTCSVHVLASELGLELLEINASDTRNQAEIGLGVGEAAKQQSLFFKGKVILIDEIDGLSGKEDRGGLSAIIKLISESAFPIILTTTNPWDQKFNSLRSKTEMVKFDSLDLKSLSAIITKIAEKEKLNISELIIKQIVRSSAGDARAAITDLEVFSYVKDYIGEINQREKEESIIASILRIFKTTDISTAITSFDNVKEDLDEQLLWLDENLPKEYTKPEDLARAYDKLSKADIFSRRIKRWQYWRFLVYINALITGGIAVSKDEKYKHFIEYKPTGRILKIWWANQKSMKRKDIAKKIAHRTHASMKRVLPYMDNYRMIFRNNKEMSERIAAELELTDEEMEWLKKQ